MILTGNMDRNSLDWDFYCTWKTAETLQSAALLTLINGVIYECIIISEYFSVAISFQSTCVIGFNSLADMRCRLTDKHSHLAIYCICRPAIQVVIAAIQNYRARL